MSDYIRPTGGAQLKANVIVLDAARAHPSPNLASRSPVAYHWSAGQRQLVASMQPPARWRRRKRPYSAYAQALAEMIRTADSGRQVFDQVRLRVNEVTKGGEVPWNASNDDAPFGLLRSRS